MAVNMSYCRFHNTGLALDECLKAIENNEIQSKEELKKAENMFENFLQFCLEQGIIQDYDEDQMKGVINESYSEED